MISTQCITCAIYSNLCIWDIIFIYFILFSILCYLLFYSSLSTNILPNIFQQICTSFLIRTKSTAWFKWENINHIKLSKASKRYSSMEKISYIDKIRLPLIIKIIAKVVQYVDILNIKDCNIIDNKIYSQYNEHDTPLSCTYWPNQHIAHVHFT